MKHDRESRESEIHNRLFGISNIALNVNQYIFMCEKYFISEKIKVNPNNSGWLLVNETTMFVVSFKEYDGTIKEINVGYFKDELNIKFKESIIRNRREISDYFN